MCSKLQPLPRQIVKELFNGSHYVEQCIADECYVSQTVGLFMRNPSVAKLWKTVLTSAVDGTESNGLKL